MVRRFALGLVVAWLAASCSHKTDAPYNPNCDDNPGQPQQDLRCTGLYTDFASKALAPDNKEYTPGLVLWSDGADKTRWLYLPPGAKIV